MVPELRYLGMGAVVVGNLRVSMLPSEKPEMAASTRKGMLGGLGLLYILRTEVLDRIRIRATPD
jgi:hypothetical protein